MTVARIRYHALPASFWTSTITAGLSPLAACLLLRARTESLIGVMRLSPRVLARAHRGVTAPVIERALRELVERGLVGWWPDDELVVVVGAALDAKGSAISAAAGWIACLPPDARSLPTTEPPVRPGVRPGPRPNDKTRQDQEQNKTSPKQGAHARPVELVRPPDPGPEIAPPSAVMMVVDGIDRVRLGLGLGPLDAAQRDARAIEERLEGGITLDTLLAIVEARGADCRAGKSKPEYLTPRSMFCKGGWTTSLRILDAARATSTSSGSTKFERAPGVVDDAALTAAEAAAWLTASNRTGRPADGHDAVIEHRLAARKSTADHDEAVDFP